MQWEFHCIREARKAREKISVVPKGEISSCRGEARMEQVLPDVEAAVVDFVVAEAVAVVAAKNLLRLIVGNEAF